MRALDAELAAVGCVASHRLHARLGRLAPEELAAVRDQITRAILSHTGGLVRHVPLFRTFPRGIPEDTYALKAITHACPALMTYFASGARMSMFDLSLLHAATRARQVSIRRPSADGSPRVDAFIRRDGESAKAFHARLVAGDKDGAPSAPPTRPALALLFRGDIELPAGSTAYALFRDQIVAPIAASELLPPKRA
jgi:hypothetical protein